MGEATCDRLFACATGTAEREALEAQYQDEATCRGVLTERQRCATYSERSICGSRRWVPENAAACIDEVRNLTCDQVSTFRPTCASPCQ